MRDVPRHPGVDGRFEDEVAASDPGGISAPDGAGRNPPIPVDAERPRVPGGIVTKPFDQQVTEAMTDDPAQRRELAETMYDELRRRVFGDDELDPERARSTVAILDAVSDDGSREVHARAGMLPDFVDSLPPERAAQHLREEASPLQRLELANAEAQTRQTERAEQVEFRLRQSGADIPTLRDILARVSKHVKRDDKLEGRATNRAAIDGDEHDTPSPEFYAEDIKRRRERFREAWQRRPENAERLCRQVVADELGIVGTRGASVRPRRNGDGIRYR